MSVIHDILPAPGYAPGGNAAFHALVDGQLSAIAADLKEALGDAVFGCLVLGGGYGRGEGGVVSARSGQRPHNDYDLVLIHHGRQRAVMRTCTAFGEKHAARCGIHVDVTPLSARRVPRLPPALTWYELGVGHRIIAGDPVLMRPLTKRTLRDVDGSEWGRLLLNRASGLLFARDVLAGGDADGVLGDEVPSVFVQRQIRKAWLALGDVELARRGVYHHLVRERLAISQRLTSLPKWWPIWEAAAHWKLAPAVLQAVRDPADEIDELEKLYGHMLEAMPVQRPRPVVSWWRTVRRIPWQRWIVGWAWPAPRVRLVQALRARWQGDGKRWRQLIGDLAGYRRLWADVC